MFPLFEKYTIYPTQQYCTTSCNTIYMKDTYAKREYKCKCGRLTEDYVWQSELAKHKVNCFQCGKELTIDNLKAAAAVQVASIRTPTKNR